MKLLNKGDAVRYQGNEYIITRVWNHGGNLVYYDMEKYTMRGRIIKLSVHYSELQNIEVL